MGCKEKHEWPELLISTTFNVFHLKNGKFNILIDKKLSEHYYGITWDEEKFFIGTRQQIFETIDFNSFHKIKDYEKNVDIHQIHYKDGNLYLTNTVHNTIDTISVNSKLLLNRIKWLDKEEDIEHINSIQYFNNKFFICCHNHGKSFIKVFDKNFHEIRNLRNIGCMSHNLIIKEDIIYTLSSHSCHFVKIFTKEKKIDIYKLKENSDHYFLRGLDEDDDNFVVGMTCNRSASGGERDMNPSYILLCDKELNILEQKTLPRAGQIREVRNLNPKYSHNAIRPPKVL